MAITTDTAIEFFGTQDTVTSGAAAVASAAFSAQGDIVAWTIDDDAPQASVTLTVSYATAPNANTYVDLFLRSLDVEGTNDQSTPSANYPHKYVGSFPIDAVTTAQYSTIDIGLPNTKTSQQYEFYIRNNTGQEIQSGWNLYVTPKTVGPSA